MDLKAHTSAQLDFPFGIVSRKPQRLARQQPSAALYAEWRGKCGSNNVIHGGIVGPVCQVKGVGGELEAALLADFEAPAQPQVQVNVVGANPGIAARSRR